jgi:hypothetical protein
MVMKFWKGFKSQKNNHDTNNPKEVIVPDPQSQSNASPDPAMGIIFEGLELAKQGNYDESELRYYQITALLYNILLKECRLTSGRQKAQIINREI